MLIIPLSLAMLQGIMLMQNAWLYYWNVTGQPLTKQTGDDMRWLHTFLVNGMRGAIQEEYLFILEPVTTKSDNPALFWLCSSQDLPNVIILENRKYKCDDSVINILQKHWAESNVFVTARKVASSVIEDNHAFK